MDAVKHAEEVAAGERFEFGENWRKFLRALDERRILWAERSLAEMLEIERLDGTSFLDIGSGSGLFSLAARRLGARVHSFDFDTASVACTAELKRRFFGADDNWIVQQGSALDRDYLDTLERFDIVYSWGVLHHTGAMWQALENAARLVAPGGRLFIAIYNDQGNASKRWRRLKRLYNHLPKALRFLVVWPAVVSLCWRRVVKDLFRLDPFRSLRAQAQGRGMSPWRDLIDWVGGYPFEVATPDAIFDFYRRRGFTLARLRTDQSLGCNEFVFVECQEPSRKAGFR